MKQVGDNYIYVKANCHIGIFRYVVKDIILTVKENGPPENYVVDFTVPFTCEYPCDDDKYVCDLNVNVLVPVARDGSAATCQEGDQTQQIVFQRFVLCIYSILLSG